MFMSNTQVTDTIITLQKLHQGSGSSRKSINLWIKVGLKCPIRLACPLALLGSNIDCMVVFLWFVLGLWEIKSPKKCFILWCCHHTEDLIQLSLTWCQKGLCHHEWITLLPWIVKDRVLCLIKILPSKAIKHHKTHLKQTWCTIEPFAEAAQDHKRWKN